jgi:hypothetical protein
MGIAEENWKGLVSLFPALRLPTLGPERGRVPEVLSLVMLGARADGDGGLRAIPVGVIEVSDWQTRFVPVTVRKRLAAAVLAGIRLGVWQGAKTALKTRGHLASCSTPPKFAYGPSELT